MKNVFLYIGLFVLLGIKSYGQGTDVIFWLDDSNSISAAEFLNTKTSVQNFANNILTCNGLNRIAITQYGAGRDNGPGTSPVAKLWIESDFTNDATVVNNLSERFSAGYGADRAHESLKIIGNALDHITDDNIWSSQKQLNHLSTNSLVIFLFTDATRSTGDSYLVNAQSSGFNSNDAFLNYTSFKINRSALFYVVIKPANMDALKAAAAIASGGGSYVGPREIYPNGPDINFVNRYLVQTDDFLIDNTDSQTFAELMCSSCPQSLLLRSPMNDLCSGNPALNVSYREAAYSITASNVICSESNGVYHAGTTVVLKPGFHSANGSKFRGYIEGCSGTFAGRLSNNEEENSSEAIQEESIFSDTNFFSLSPNPAISAFTVTSTLDVKHITVTSFDGKVMFNKDVKDKTTSYTIDVNGYTPGIYTVTVLTQTGEIQTQKLIKN